MRSAKLFVCLLASFIIPSAAQAACTASTSAVNFGPYDPRSAASDDAAGQVAVNCSGEGWFVWSRVTISSGTSGTRANRTMRAGANVLNYNLYTDNGRTQIWGDGSSGTSAVNVPVFFGFGSRTVYGRIQPLQNVGAGSYQDTVVVTVEY